MMQPKFFSSLNLPVIVSPITFGISPSNPDNTPNFNAAIAYVASVGGGCITLDEPGVYVVGSPDAANLDIMIALQSNVSIHGCSGSIIKVADGLNTDTSSYRVFGYSGATPLEDVTIAGLSIDLNGTNNPVTVAFPGAPSQAVYVKNGLRVTIRDCHLFDCPGRQFVFFGADTAPQSCTDIQILNNRFDTCGTAVPGNVNQTDHSSIYCQAIRAEIRGNSLTNPVQASEAAALEIHSQQSIIAANEIEAYGVGINIVASVTDQVDTVYADNTIKEINAAIQFYAFTGFTMQRVLVTNNVFLVASTSLRDCIDANLNIQAGSVFTDIDIVGNDFKGAYTDFTGELHGVTVGDAQRFRVKGNRFNQFTGSAVTTGTITAGQLELDVEDNVCLDVGATDTSISRSAIRMNNVNALRKASVVRNVVGGAVVGTGTTAIGNADVTNVSDPTVWALGMPISGTGIPANTTVSNIVGTTITMSNTATANGSTTIFGYSSIGFDANADIGEATVQWNLFERATIGALGSEVTLSGSITSLRLQKQFPQPAASPSATVFGSPFANSSIVLDNLAGGNAQFAVAFNGTIAHWMLWNTTQLQIATAGATRLLIDNDQFNPNTTNAMNNGLAGSRWSSTYTNGLAVNYSNNLTPGISDFYIHTNAGTVTLPAASQATGRRYYVENTNGGSTATVTRTGGDTINGAASDKTMAANELAFLISDGVSDWRYCVVGTVT